MTRTAWMMAGLLLAGTAQAQDKTDRELEVRYKGVTEIDFSTLDVQGQLVRPQLEYINTLTGMTHKSLIKPRVEFDREMKHSVDEIK